MLDRRGKITRIASAVSAAVVTVSASALLVTRAKQRKAREEGKHVPAGPYEAVFKRSLDLAIAIGSLVVLSPVLLGTSLAVLYKLGSPIVFSQVRPGLNEKPFKMYKFRTMDDKRDEETGALLPDADRLTSFGKLLRSTSLDELPELVNILKGDMSLIGPRPLLMEYLPLYNEEQAHRHDVKPGMTGLAQIRGRNSISWERKFEYDVEYVNNCTFKTDLAVFIKTFKLLARRTGISSRTSLTMEAFTGASEPKDQGKTHSIVSNQSKKPVVWILNHYATNTFKDRGGRHYELGKRLVEQGYEVRILCASTVHNSEINLLTKTDSSLYVSDELDGILYTFVKTRPYKGNGRDRILNMIDYYQAVLRIADDLPKPSVVIGSSVHPLACVAGLQLAKRYSIPCICEIRDLWPESLVEYGMMQRDSLLAKGLYRGERWIYENADALIFTVEGGADYLQDQGWCIEQGGKIDLQKVFYINNGVDLKKFDQSVANKPFEHAALMDDGIAKIVYAGSIRAANDIGFLVDVAKLLPKDEIRIVIIGDGEERSSLEKRCKDEHVDNVAFVGRIDKSLVPSALNQGTIMAMMYSRNQRGLSKYGMSQNKQFDYLASGKPIISNLPSNYSIVNCYNCGFEGSFETPAACAEKIIEMLADESMLVKWGLNSRKAAADYDFDVLTDKLLDMIHYVGIR